MVRGFNKSSRTPHLGLLYGGDHDERWSLINYATAYTRLLPVDQDVFLKWHNSELNNSTIPNTLSLE